VLTRLTAAGSPWLALAPHPGAAPPGTSATVIDVSDLREVPLTVDPFEPAPGYPVQAHSERLAALLEAAFRPSGPVRAAIRLALRRVYMDRGWDLAAGGSLPGAVAPPGIPTLGDLCRAAESAAADLGCDVAARAALRALLDVTLGPLWTGPAGRFLAGGHPPDVIGLLASNAIFTTGGIAADDAVAFLTGVLLLRLTELLRGQKPETRPIVVVAIPAGRLRRILDDVRAAGINVILARSSGTGNGSDNGSDDGSTEAALEGGLSDRRPVPVQALLQGRRSVACGLQCRQRPCTGHELHDADLRAAADGQVWLRLWVQALVLAFITGRPLPHVPQPLRQASHQHRDARARECLLATVVDAAVGSRSLALRHSYQPERLTAAVASVAAGQLAAAGPGHASSTIPPRAGRFWVIPQLRWLHEAERLHPLAQHQPGPDDMAPPLDFGLAGLVDWPGISVGDRLEGLYRHRLSMENEPNRTLARTALLGAEPDKGIAADLVIVGIGRDQPERLRYAARMLGTVGTGNGSGPGWLEVVLSWPERLIVSTWEPGLRQAATG
jgi:uncharacterized protein